MARFCRTLKNIARAAVGAEGLATFAEWQEYSGMSIPEWLGRQRAVQRQIRAADLHLPLFAPVGIVVRHRLRRSAASGGTCRIGR
jgi:hypothetical protein